MSVISVSKLRPLSGISLIWLSVTSPDTDAVVVFTTVLPP